MQADLADIAHWKFCIGMVEMWDSHEECFGEPTLLAGHAQDKGPVKKYGVPQMYRFSRTKTTHKLRPTFARTFTPATASS